MTEPALNLQQTVFSVSRLVPDVSRRGDHLLDASLARRSAALAALGLCGSVAKYVVVFLKWVIRQE